MMDITENPKLDLSSSYESLGSEEKISTQKISVSDHKNGFQYKTDKSDSFVIDMESFSRGGGANKEINPNSRSTAENFRFLQQEKIIKGEAFLAKGLSEETRRLLLPIVQILILVPLSMIEILLLPPPPHPEGSSSVVFRIKVPSRLTKKRAVPELEYCLVFNKFGAKYRFWKIVLLLMLFSWTHVLMYSLKFYGSSTHEKPTVVALGSTDHVSNPQVHHQITITTGNITAATESRFSLRRNSFRRSPPPWLLDPKRILLFFATLSSVGTILLIYFTLSISKMNGDENALD